MRIPARPPARTGPCGTRPAARSSAAGDGGGDLDPAVVAARRVGLRRLAVDEHVDVLAQDAALVEDPTLERAVGRLEPLEQLGHRRALDVVPGAAAGELLHLSA